MIFWQKFFCSVVKSAFCVSKGPFLEKFRYFPKFLAENFWMFVLRKRIFSKHCTFLKSYWDIDLKLFRFLAKDFREVSQNCILCHWWETLTLLWRNQQILNLFGLWARKRLGKKRKKLRGLVNNATNLSRGYIWGTFFEKVKFFKCLCLTVNEIFSDLSQKIFSEVNSDFSASTGTLWQKTFFFRENNFLWVSDIEQKKIFWQKTFCSVVKTAICVSGGPFWENFRFSPKFYRKIFRPLFSYVCFLKFVLRKRTFWKNCVFIKSLSDNDLEDFNFLAEVFQEVPQNCILRDWWDTLKHKFFLWKFKNLLNHFQTVSKKKVGQKGEKLSAGSSKRQSIRREETPEGNWFFWKTCKFWKNFSDCKRNTSAIYSKKFGKVADTAFCVSGGTFWAKLISSETYIFWAISYLEQTEWYFDRNFL